jgi:hypothetical protein
VQVQPTTGGPAAKRPGGGLKGMSGPAYLQRSHRLLGRIQQLQREHRLTAPKGARDENRSARPHAG